MKNSLKFIVILIGIAAFLSACGATSTDIAPATSTVDVQATANAMVATMAAQTMQAIPTETPIPTPTEVPFYLTATIWTKDPRVPIINFHQFAPNTSEHSTDHKVRFEDFWSYMDQLNQAGYTLIAVEDWIGGDIYVPEG